MSENEKKADDPAVDEKKFRGAQWSVVGMAVASVVFAVFYRIVEHVGFGHTSMMFIGIPAILAILLAMTPMTKSATGGILKGMTLVMLIMAPIMGEGAVCILIAAPIFYLVGILVGLIVDWQRKKQGITLSCCALVLLPMSLEGVVPQLTFDRQQTVSVSRVVVGTPEEVATALARGPRLTTPITGVFPTIGFPRPLDAQGEGLEIGATRRIHFAGVEDAPPGDVVMRVTESRPGFARFDAISDSTKLGKWLHWKNSEVAWKAVDATHTQVIWQMQFERELDPAWYFTPLERFAVHDAAAFLIAANVTPVRP